MASSYPTRPRSAFLEWCELHGPIFSDHAAEIGLSVEEAAAFAAATTKGRTKLFAQGNAQEASKAATSEAGEAFDDLSRVAGNAVRTIRAFAQTSADPTTVYSTAKIPSPSTPSPQPPPGQPENLTVLLDPSVGTVTLRWKCKNPVGSSGTSYIIRRRLPGEAQFTFIGVSGKKSFVDESLVAGPDSVEYIVQAQRADQTGPNSILFTINFGRLPNGARTATVSTAGNVPGVLNVELPAPTGNGRSLVTSR